MMPTIVSVVVGASALAIASLVAVEPAAAEADGNSAETVVVTATRAPTPLSDVPLSISVVTAKDIADTPAAGLDDILRNLPGMTLNAIGPDVGHPTAYNESMRGLPTTDTRMLVMVDEVPLNDPFFGYIQWNRVPLDNIDRVEVVRGGGSPLWGSTAMGGVVNVITRAPQADMLDLSAAGGSYGSYDTSVYASPASLDWVKLSVNGAFRGTDGYQTTPASWTSFGTLNLRSPVFTPTSNHAQNVGVRADLEPMPDLTGFVSVNYGEDSQVLTTPIGLDKQHIWTYAAGLTKTFGEGTSLSANFFHDDDWFLTNNPHLVTPTFEFVSNIHTTTATDNGASVVLTRTMDGWLRMLSVGADYHQVSGQDLANYFASPGVIAAPTIIGGGDQLFLAGFGQARILPVDALEIMASLRYQYYLSSNGIDTFPPAFSAIPNTAKYRFTPRVDARYSLDDGFAVRGAYYQSFRAPTLDQLYRTFADTSAGIFEGNPLLKPETLEGEEIGFDYVLPGVRSQFTFYNSTISNLITQRNLVPAEFPSLLGVECGFDPATFMFLSCTRNINAASAIARGFEAEVDWEIGDGFSSQETFTYADSQYTANPADPTAVGERLEGVPMYNASAGLTYDNPSGWQASAILRYMSKSFGDPHPQDGLIQNAHFVVDVSGSYPLAHNLQAFVAIQNLFDVHYIASNGGGAPILGTPFRVMSGVRATFQ